LYLANDILCEAEGCPGAAKDLAEYAAKRWSPHRIFVLDIARLAKDHSFRIVECGSVNTAGLYKCQMKPVVEAMSRLAAEGN
jgi:hypothetical protein